MSPVEQGGSQPTVGGRVIMEDLYFGGEHPTVGGRVITEEHYFEGHRPDVPVPYY